MSGFIISQSLLSRGGKSLIIEPVKPTDSLYWHDFSAKLLENLFELIAKAAIGGTVGTLIFSDTFHAPPSGKSWETSPSILSSI